MSDLSQTIDTIASGIEAFKTAQIERMDKLETRMNRPGAFHAAPGVEQTEVRQLKTADGRMLPILSAKQNFADLYRGERDDFSLAQFCKDAIVGSRETRAASGPALVPTALGSVVIDAVRNMVHADNKKLVLLQGLEDFIVVDTPDVLMICRKDKEQDIKQYVAEIKRSKGDKFL